MTRRPDLNTLTAATLSSLTNDELRFVRADANYIATEIANASHISNGMHRTMQHMKTLRFEAGQILAARASVKQAKQFGEMMEKV